jgi:two-component system CheB/CheR fusion protein
MVEEELFSQIIDNLLDGIIIIDADKKIVYWNKWIEQTSEIEKPRAIGKSFLEIFPDLEFTRIDTSIDLAIEKSQSSFIAHIMNPIMLPLYYHNPGGAEKSRVFHNIRVTSIQTSEKVRVLLHISDETSNVRKETLLKARAAEEKILSEKLKLSAAVIANTTEGVVITDENAIVEDVNASFTEILGYKRNDMIGNHVRILKSGKHSEEFYRGLWNELNTKGQWKGEFINKKPDNSLIVVESSITEIKNSENKVTNYVNIFHDVTSRKKHEELLEKWSKTDQMTGLGNRRAFDEDIEMQWRICMRHQFYIGLIILDVDYFKKFNDNYGHKAGDDCLVKISDVLQINVRRGDDKISRYGGEEFVIILTQTSETGLEKIASSILKDVAALKIPHEGSDVAAHVTISAGISMVIPNMETSWSELLDMADQALYEAKNSGRNKFCIKKITN